MEKMIDILGAIIQGDINKTLKISNELMDEGKEPQSYIAELLKLLESIYLKDSELIELYSEQEKELLEKYMNIDKFKIYKIIKEVLNIITLMKNMENKRVMLIAALMNLAGNNNIDIHKAETSNVVLGSEKAVKHNITQTNTSNSNIINNVNKVNDVKSNENINNNKNYIQKDELKEKFEEEKNDIKKEMIEKEVNLSSIKEKVDMLAIRKYMLINKEMKLFVVLNNAEIYVENNNAYLVSKVKLSNDIICDKNLEIIKNAIKNITGKEYIVEYVEKK
ncbi:MAG: hypothetical protein HXK70_02175 [Clostridiales bacterium]|nr:hypothetical protein [Clostridiales bacterium]